MIEKNVTDSNIYFFAFERTDNFKDGLCFIKHVPEIDAVQIDNVDEYIAFLALSDWGTSLGRAIVSDTTAEGILTCLKSSF